MNAGFIMYLLFAPVHTFRSLEASDEVYNSSSVRVSDHPNNTDDPFNQFPIDLWIRNGFFKMDYFKKINPLWTNAGPQSNKSHYILAGFYAIFMSVGIAGNMLVIFMVLRFKSLKTPSINLVLNLAISDLLMMLKMPMFIYNSVYMGPALGEMACRIYGFIGGLSGTCSICTISAISLDRFYVVKYPLNLRFTSARAKVCVAISWIYALAFSIIPLLGIGLGEYKPEGYLTSCSFDYLSTNPNHKRFILAFFVSAWVVPFGLISFSYANILIVVIGSRRITQKNNKNRESARHMKIEQRKQQELRLTFMVFLVIILWFVAWTPYSIVALLGVFGRQDAITPLVSMVPALFCKTASCIDPFLYALTHPRFKSEFKNVFSKSRKSVRNDTMKMWSAESKRRRNDSKITFSDQIDFGETIVLESQNVQVPSWRRIGVVKEVNSDGSFQNSKKCKPAWWYKPTFSNRSSSLRNIARSISNLEKRVAPVDISNSV